MLSTIFKKRQSVKKAVLEKQIGEKFQQALALHQEGKLLEAENLYSQIIEMDPKHANSLQFLGVLAYQKQAYSRAMELIEKAIAINPKSAAFYSNLGVVQMDMKRYKEARDTYEKAIKLNPNNVDFHYNHGNALAELKQLGKAIESYERAKAMNPDLDFIADYLLQAKMHLCLWDDFDGLLAEIVGNIQKNKLATPFTMLSLIDDPAIHKQAAQSYVQKRHPFQAILPQMDPYLKHAKIRLGYFSSDFRNHPVSALTAQLYELHDRERFEVHAFSLCKDNDDEMNLRIKAGVDHFHSVWDMSDKDIAMLARKLEIDIAIDLGGHTKESRTSIFAMRAAPIQINYIGYLGTMGADYFDYLIADHIMVPKASQQHYCEKIAYLPHFQVNDGKRNIPDRPVSRQEFGLPQEGFVFCCFNNSYKVTPQVFASWMRILEQAPGSVLLLYVESALAEKNIRKELVRHGMDEKRVIFAKRLAMDDYLARYKVADLFLDTLPYNAGATASDALRMGLPVLTCMGESYASRMAGSLLHALNMPELVTTSRQAYESLAIKLASDSEAMREMKAKLARNLATAPLFDGQQFTKNIEAAYVTMHDRCHSGVAIDHVDV